MHGKLSTTTAPAATPNGHAASPTQPDLSTLPVNVDRRRGAELVTRYFFPVSHRSLERWPLVGRVVNGRLVFATAELFAHARALMDAAPSIRGGKRPVETAAAA